MVRRLLVLDLHRIHSSRQSRKRVEGEKPGERVEGEPEEVGSQMVKEQVRWRWIWFGGGEESPGRRGAEGIERGGVGGSGFRVWCRWCRGALAAIRWILGKQTVQIESRSAIRERRLLHISLVDLDHILKTP